MDIIQGENNQIAIYARVSSSNQENEGTIETQLSAVYAFAKDKGYRIIQEYADNGWSGDSIVRPELDRLRVDAKKKLWDAVLIYDPDRLARRYSYQELVMDELREAGIEVLFVTTPAPSNGIEKILYGVQGLFAEYERAKITERFRLGKVRKANEGHIIVSEAPYGYTFIPKQGKRGEADFRQGYYEVNEYEADVVNRIFLWVAKDGLTIRALVKRLQELSIPPRKSKRGVWNTSTLSTLLRNKTYIGEGHFGASYATVPVNPLKKEGYRKVKKTSRRSKPEEEWIKIPTPKIIDEALFFKVQERLKSNAESSNRNTKNEYLLASKIWCTCGKRRTGEGAMNGKHLYYRCTDRVKSFPLPPSCLEAGLNARRADKLVWQHIAELMSSPDLILMQAERWLHEQKSKPVSPSVNIETLTKEISKLKEQETRYTKAFGAGLVSMEQLKEYLEPVREKIAALKSQVEKAGNAKSEVSQILMPDKTTIEAFVIEAIKQLSNLNFVSKKAIIKEVVEKVIGTREKLQVYGYIPVSNLNHVSLCSDNRYGANTIPHESGNTDVKQNEIPFAITIQMAEGMVKNIFDLMENKRAA